MTTPSLFGDEIPAFVPDAGRGTIQERFELFHLRNGWVYAALEKLTAEYIGGGRRRIGIKMLVEVVRWHFDRATTDPTSEFKINNSFSSRYARLLIANHPEWSQAFETRRLKAK